MSQNLVRNGSFSDGALHWSHYGWYSGNTINFLSSGGNDGACVELTVPSEGDPGQSYIYQYVPMLGGHTYTVSFHAKRTSSVDVWVQLTANSSTVNSPSLIQYLPTDSAYHEVSVQLTVPGTSNVATRAVLRLIAGSAGGTARFDSVEILDNKVFLPSYYVETDANTVIHKQASVSNINYGSFPANAKFVYDGVDGDWVAVLFGRADGMTINAFIPKAQCWSSNTALEQYAENRMATIAKSLVGVYGVQLGLNGAYCEDFIHWLAGACDLSNSIYCDDSRCGYAVRHYSEAGIYSIRNGSTALSMQCGDIAYYDVVNYGTNDVTAAHAGYVVSTNGNTYTAIEGNAAGPVQQDQQKVATVTGNRITGTNSVHSRVLHGVAHPFGQG